MEYGIIKGLSWYRLFASFWAVAIVVLSYDKLLYPSYAVMAAAALVVISFTIQQIAYKDPSLLMRSEVVVSDLIFSILITLLGGYVYVSGTSSTTLAFASQYILASVLMTGVAFGLSGGVLAGILIGIARTGASAINKTEIANTGHILSLISTTVTYSLAGALVGGVVTLMRKAGGELSETRARDNVARTLHDGVLQTLVIIQKRSKEPEIAELASRQEQELRSFLFSHQSHASNSVVSLHNALENVVESFSKKNSIPVSIVIAPDIEGISKSAVKAIVGACTECLSNIDKHAEASSVTIYAEPDGDMCIVSVRDDGKGFDVTSTLEESDKNSSEKKQGLKSSVVGRIEEIGGVVTIKSSSKGTEIEIKVPLQLRTSKKETAK